jgi:hypothetical protein
MGMVIGVAEFLEKVSKLKSRKEKVEALKANDFFSLKTVLQGAFHPNLEWLLPPGQPPFKANELQDQENMLHKEARRLVYFVKNGQPVRSQTQREAMFIELLEAVTPADALLLCAIKEKKLPYKGITADIVAEAFPGILGEEPKKSDGQVEAQQA